MPSATLVFEKDVQVAASGITRLDDPGTNPSPSGRYWVRVINPNPTYRVFIGHQNSGLNVMNNTNCETVDPFNGVWEDSLGSTIPIYAMVETGAPAIIVRVKQYA